MKKFLRLVEVKKRREEGGRGEGLVWVDLWVAEGGRGLTFGLRGEVTQPSS